MEQDTGTSTAPWGQVKRHTTKGVPLNSIYTAPRVLGGQVTWHSPTELEAPPGSLEPSGQTPSHPGHDRVI